MIQLAFRNIFRHKVRTGLTLLAILLGVAGIILSGGFVEDIFVQLRESTIHSQLGHLQVYKKGYYEHGRRQPYEYMIASASDLAAKFGTFQHVKDVMMRINFSGLLNNGHTDHQIIGEGIEPAKEARLGSSISIIAGRQLNADDQYAIVVGEGVARSLRLKPNDYATLLVNTPEAGLNSLEFRIVGVFQTFSKDYDARAVRIPLAAAQELLVTDHAHSLVFSLDDSSSTASVVDQVKAILPADVYEVFAWNELAEFYRKAVDLYRRQFGVLELIILVMVMLSVANSVNMAIYERMGEYGTLMALGSYRSDVFRLILIENALLGLLGAVLGITIGVSMSAIINQIGIPMPPPPNSNTGYTAFIRIVPSVLEKGLLVGIVAAVLAAILPARRVAKTPIVDALRENV